MLPVFRLGISVVILAMSATCGELSVRDYKQARRDVEERTQNLILGHVDGLAQGMIWANAAMNAATGRKLFCRPEKLALGVTTS